MAKKEGRCSKLEPEAVTICDKLYGYLFGHNKQYNALFLNIE